MSGTRKRPGNEEPEPTSEADLPSDGRDEKGEAMIRDLPRRVEPPQSLQSPGKLHNDAGKGGRK